MRRGMARPLMAAAVSLGLTMTLAACGGSDSAGDGSAGSVVYDGFGGDGQEAQASAWLEPFTEETGITVTQDSPMSYTRIQQMVQAGEVIWDVVDGGADMPGGVQDNPALAEIDCEIVSCDDFTGPHLAQPQGVPSYIYAYVLAYNTDEVGADVPVGLQDLWNTEDFPGTRMIDGTYGFLGLLEAAVVHAGVPRDQIYPIDVDLAFSELDKIKDDLVFYSDQQECVNAVSSGEAIMGMCFNGRTTLTMDEGLPIDIAWGQQAQAAASIIIPRDAPNLENAQRLAAWITSAEHNGEISNFLPYAPANPLATPVGQYADDVPTENELTGDDAPLFVQLEWWGENAGDMYERVATWTGQ